MTQAILLVGGMGTRLMPLTKSVPKPMLPLAGLPVTEHQLAMAKRAGITSIVLATSYLSEVFLPYFGDGSAWDIKIQYAIEDAPLGTGGAIRNAAQLLNANESIVILNGDVLSSHDLSAQIAFHEAMDADVTLHLTHVEDARAFGCVPIDSDGRVSAFLEKMENPITNTINAGCYVFHPRVIEKIPADAVVSIERETFPSLIQESRRIFAVVDDSYWLDIGTPSALLKGSADLVAGRANASALDSADLKFRSHEYVALAGAVIDPSAQIDGGSAIGSLVHIGPEAKIHGSIISDGATISEGVSIVNSFISAGAYVPRNTDLLNEYFGNEGVFPLITTNSR